MASTDQSNYPHPFTVSVRCAYLLRTLSRENYRRVATLAPNVPAMQELYFAVPMAEAVLCTLNIRLDSSIVADLLKHSEANIIFVDQQLLQIAQGALSPVRIKKEIKRGSEIEKKRSFFGGFLNSVPPIRETYNIHEYENLLASGSSNFTIRWSKTEMDPISVNYISGTTSPFKGIVYNYRGAYLNTIATFIVCGMGPMTTYLWTVPMFHGNGWRFLWAMAALGGTNVCLRQKIYLKSEWDSLPLEERAELKARQGVQHLCIEKVEVRDIETTKRVPADGKTIGDIVLRWNTVMS
ncbi:hypothetical protein RND71_038250 [Anisodus tanguticus]|uniref:AMP-dependent synthetase/ligase domain-containing protein n=1 Tax=Anisodus tanguticus TaxID=243964 RepID=A0AAE1QYP0_9SOLA|nr:hypothetical protein RND71_038250 [Anisodus tanguticus]